MSYPGPPGVNSAHPSLPPRPPTAAKPGPLPPKIASVPTQPPSLPPARFSSTFSSAASSPATIAAAPPSLPSYPGAPPGYASPANAPASSSYAGPTTYSAAPAPTTQYGAPPTTYGPHQPGGRGHMRRGRGGYQRGGHHSNDYSSNQYNARGGGFSHHGGGGYNPAATTATAAYPGAYGSASAGYPSAAPYIRNPFPAPTQAGPEQVPAAAPIDSEAEMAAQIAQWQSAYIPRDASAADPTAEAGGYGYGPAAAAGGIMGPVMPDGTLQQGGATAGEPADGAQPAERRKTVYRQGGGKKWADDTLTEWDPSHLRLFVGNLAGETTDESLLKAFSRWKSVQRAKVVRDKRTTRSKGFGFVSFSDPDDFFQAAKEMNGKYIQSHPVTVKKSTTEIKITTMKDDKRGGGGNGGKKDMNGTKKSGKGSGVGGGGGYEPHLGPVAPGGIVKSGQKTKGGLKLLG